MGRLAVKPARATAIVRYDNYFAPVCVDAMPRHEVAATRAVAAHLDCVMQRLGRLELQATPRRDSC